MKVKLFADNLDSQEFPVDGKSFPRLIEYRGLMFERFNPLSTEDVVRYCQVSVARLSDIVVDRAVDVAATADF